MAISDNKSNSLYRPLMLGGVAVFVAGVLFWGAFNWTLELTNTETFCISCHEMRKNVYEEFKETVHYSNASGVRATCPDCHVPREWKDKVVRKVRASNELIHKIIGSIDTREKFQAKRLQLAESVWETLEGNDSLECRNCHQLDYMHLDQQREASNKAHSRAEVEGITCIACHKGIAHSLPEEYLDTMHDEIDEKDLPCTQCHESMRVTDDWYP